MSQKMISAKVSDSIKAIDEKLSKRSISLDPKGYFLIKLNYSTNEIIVEHYTNDINDVGVAINPETGQPLRCTGSEKRTPANKFKGKTAKELGIQLTETCNKQLMSSFDHALYLGRELQKAEESLKTGRKYIQD